MQVIGSTAAAAAAPSSMASAATVDGALPRQNVRLSITQYVGYKEL